MNHSPAPEVPVTPTAIVDGGVKQGMSWIREGAHLVWKQKRLWIGMAGVYFVFGSILKLIPFMGDLLLILITPMLLSGAVWGCLAENRLDRTLPPSTTRTKSQEQFQHWVVQPAQELLFIFTQEQKVFGAVLLGIVTLGLTMMVKITGYLLIGGSMLSGLTAHHISAPQLTTVLGMLVIAGLYFVLIMGFLFSVPLTVLGRRQPFQAVSDSFTTCQQHPRALLTLTVPFFLVFIFILTVFSQSRWLGYLSLFSVGLAAAPLFVAAVYSSYLALFPPEPPDTPP